MALTGYLFYMDILSAVTQTTLWCVVFFFASAAASAGYLTVSEVFPMEIRAMAIAALLRHSHRDRRHLGSRHLRAADRRRGNGQPRTCSSRLPRRRGVHDLRGHRTR